MQVVTRGVQIEVILKFDSDAKASSRATESQRSWKTHVHHSKAEDAEKKTHLAFALAFVWCDTTVLVVQTSAVNATATLRLESIGWLLHHYPANKFPRVISKVNFVGLDTKQLGRA